MGNVMTLEIGKVRLSAGYKRSGTISPSGAATLTAVIAATKMAVNGLKRSAIE